ncbi:DMT family transporter [Brevibacillus composti]|uniref:DMT family transporter n=1 Tax=Brevibacillus composti TaxID=2796470 RepID=A0A7T5ELT1_9BACL|nr:DMT family transporter [Brevibacillus composti]QQE74975.1 DMT family transporter [Brevibacillus composti]QUO42060.1 DMT family transporter [Brevibacillus composti]
MNKLYTGVLYVFLSAAGFGVMSIFAIYAYGAGASVSTLLFLRFLLAALLFFGWMALKREPLGITKKQGIALFCLGGVLYTLQSLSFFSSVQYIPASLAGLLLYTFPVYVTVLNYFVNKEALRKQTIGAILLSLAGLVMVLGLSFDGVQPLGVVLALAAAAFYAIYFIVGNRVVSGLSPYVTSAYVSLFAACSTFGLALRDGGPDFGFGMQGWLALGGIVLFSTILAMACLFRGIQLIGSTRASVLSTLEPVVTIGFSALLFGERLGMLQLLGGCAVLLGAVWIVRSQGKQAEDSVEA